MDLWETKIYEHSGLRYKIQMRQVSGIYQQRHIWYPCENPAYPRCNEYKEDNWIRSTQDGPGLHFTMIDSRDAITKRS